MADNIKYVDHPCSEAVKKQWNAKGYRVVDSKFAPPDAVIEPKAKPKATKK